MFADKWGDIAVNSDDLQKAVFCSKFGYMLIGFNAVRIPISSEVNQTMSMSVSLKIIVESLQIIELFQVANEAT